MKTKQIAKLFFINSLLLLTATTSMCQMMVMPRFIDEYNIVDSSRVIVQYSLEFVNDPNNPGSVDTDIIILEIGTKVSKSYSYSLLKHDSIATANKRSSGVPMLQIAVPPVEVFKNYPTDKNTIVHRAPLSAPIFLYQDEINIEWTILPQNKQISGYRCQKAIATFRGRTWEAWFTSQIPVSDGPWKFHGLPGLILEVSDDQSHFRFTCIGLSREKVPIKKWKWNYERTSRNRVNSILYRYAESPYIVGPQIGIKFGFVDSSLKDKSIPYNPLELE
ncbi:MAG: GLPGLI family protein [Bacteroidota bacterium]